MAITQLKHCNEIPSQALDDWGPVPEPVSDQISHLSGLVISENKDGSEADFGSVRREYGQG